MKALVNGLKKKKKRYEIHPSKIPFPLVSLAGLIKHMANPMIPNSNTETPPSGRGEAPPTWPSPTCVFWFPSGYLKAAVLLFVYGMNYMQKACESFEFKVCNLIRYFSHVKHLKFTYTDHLVSYVHKI